jgi:hydrogenase maturation protease
LTDDAAGPLVIDALTPYPAGSLPDGVEVDLRDGGTMGLSLLPDIEDAQSMIAVDAAAIGAAPGTVRVFEGAAMDAQLGGRKRTAHEVALFDLMAAATLAGSLPQQRALVAVQPADTALGLEPSEAVAQAIPQLCDEVRQLLRRWAS